MLLSHGILGALVARQRTGRGQRVDSSLYGSQIALQGIQYGRGVYSVPLATGGRAYSSFSYRAFCADGVWIAFGYLTADFWPRLCRALDLEWMTTHEKFGDPVDRAQNEYEFVEILDAQVASRPSSEWLERMVEADVPCTVVQDYQMISEDPQALANSYVLRYETSAFGEAHAQGFPWSFSETPPSLRREAPAVPGMHSSEILHAAGFSTGETSALLACGAVQGS
jgi:crotonobetainyl-CoA:carnitine CoA-transferase CaiB-like acyl-CoA transferase